MRAIAPATTAAPSWTWGPALAAPVALAVDEAEAEADAAWEVALARALGGGRTTRAATDQEKVSLGEGTSVSQMR